MKPGIIKANFKVLIIFSALIIISLHSAAVAQDVISLRLKMPPPNQLGIADMWNLEINNTSGKDMKIYLTASVSEEKDGRVADAKSKTFTVKPGKTNYGYNDFSGAELKYSGGKYKEIILRTGNMPEGSYTVCVTAYNESGEVTGQESCINQTVHLQGNISLVQPGDGEAVDIEQPVTFNWTPLPNTKEYSLRLVEIQGNQSPEAALKNNRPVWEVNGIRTAAVQMQNNVIENIKGSVKEISGNKLTKKYAWLVTAGTVESEPFMFRINFCKCSCCGAIVTNNICMCSRCFGTGCLTEKYLDHPHWVNLKTIFCERQGVLFVAAKDTHVNHYILSCTFEEITYYESGTIITTHPLPQPFIISYVPITVPSPAPLYCDQQGRPVYTEYGIYLVTKYIPRNSGIVDLGSNEPIPLSFSRFADLWNAENPGNEVDNSCNDCEMGEISESEENEIESWDLLHWGLVHLEMVMDGIDYIHPVDTSGHSGLPHIIHDGNNIKLLIRGNRHVKELKYMGLVLSTENPGNLFKCACGKNAWANSKEAADKICDYLKDMFRRKKENPVK